MATMANATAAAVLALTTPFVQPPTCSDIFSTTSITRSWTTVSYSSSSYSTVIITGYITVSNRDDPRFAACQPSGWAEVPTQSQFSFSPAVCPSGWTAYGLDTTAATVSTAYCCASGYYYYSSPLWLGDATISGVSSFACFNTEGSSSPATMTTTTAGEGFYPSDITVHNAYHISWRQPDRATLSPRPPNLTCSLGIRTWVPGATTTPTTICDDNKASSGDDGLSPTPLFMFLVIGIPVIAGFFICLCCGTCFFYVNKERALPAAQAGSYPMT